MNPICTILLIVAAGLIGYLLPHKVQVKIEEKFVEKEPNKFGLYMPPGCAQITFSNISYYFCHSSRGYNSVTLNPKEDKNIKISFGYNNELVGEVK